jgi:hypothetical protein
MNYLIGKTLVLLALKPQLATALLLAAGVSGALGQAAGIINGFGSLRHRSRPDDRRGCDFDRLRNKPQRPLPWESVVAKRWCVLSEAV